MARAAASRAGSCPCSAQCLPPRIRAAPGRASMGAGPHAPPSAVLCRCSAAAARRRSAPRPCAAAGQHTRAARRRTSKSSSGMLRSMSSMSVYRYASCANWATSSGTGSRSAVSGVRSATHVPASPYSNSFACRRRRAVSSAACRQCSWPECRAATHLAAAVARARVGKPRERITQSACELRRRARLGPEQPVHANTGPAADRRQDCWAAPRHRVSLHMRTRCTCGFARGAASPSSLAPHWRPMAASAARTAACCAVVCAGVLVRLACAWLLDAGEFIAARVELATPVDRIELCA